MSTDTATLEAATIVGAPQTARQKFDGLVASYCTLAAKVDALKEAAASRIKPLTDSMAEIFTELQQVAKANRAELFGDTKTLGLELATVGYKLGDKKLVLPESLNMKWFMQTVRDAAPGAIDEKVNDKNLVAALAVLPDLANVFKKREIQVVQGESFYITPKKPSKKQKKQAE